MRLLALGLISSLFGSPLFAGQLASRYDSEIPIQNEFQNIYSFMQAESFDVATTTPTVHNGGVSFVVQGRTFAQLIYLPKNTTDVFYIELKKK